MRALRSGNIEMKRLITIMEAAEYLSMGRNSCRAFLDEIGAIRSFGGRRIYADRNIIDRWLDMQIQPD